MVVYDDLATGEVQVSLTSSSGPWTSLTLTSPKRLQDALAEWAAQASAALGGAWVWNWFDDGDDDRYAVNLTGPAGFWLRTTDTLCDLLGLAGGVMHGDPTIANASIPLGVVMPRAAGRTQPRAVESVELVSYRMGRSAAYSTMRAVEVKIEASFAESLVPEIEISPLFSGHCAMTVGIINDDDYGEDDLDGALLTYPIETPSIEETDGSGDEVCVSILGVLEGG